MNNTPSYFISIRAINCFLEATWVEKYHEIKGEMVNERKYELIRGFYTFACIYIYFPDVWLS